MESSQFDEFCGLMEPMSFEKVVSLEMSFILADFLSISDIYLKLALLNKGYAKISQQLKECKSIWMAKFVKEFQSEFQMQENKDKELKKVYELILYQFPNFLDDLDLKEKNEPFLIH